MLEEASSVCSDISVLRRLSFAATSLPKDTPRYWELVTEFGFQFSTDVPSCKNVQVLVENMQYMDRGALDTDNCLLKELIHHRGFDGHQLGIVLVSANDTCNMCAGKLRVRADRPSFPTIYSDELGTVSATHFRKHCSNHGKGCSFTQHYGFHMTGNESDIMYDTNCLSLPFFLSSHATGFQTQMLHSFTAEILLGQISYRQRSEIYNYTHGYDLSIKLGPKRVPNMESSSKNAATLA